MPSENRYPAALHDVLDAYADRKFASETSSFLGGASACACIAASAAMHNRDTGGNSPDGLVLVSGTFHAALSSPSDSW